MTDRVRYEQRIFLHRVIPERDESDYDRLLCPLEKICTDLQGYDIGLGHGLVNPNEKTYLVGKRNGSLAFVEICVPVNLRARFVTVVNLEKFEHPELLEALHAFYDGKEGYHGMPEPVVIKERAF